MKILSSFTYLLIIPNLYEFPTVFLWNIKEDILKNVGNKTFLVTIAFHCMNQNKNKQQKITKSSKKKVSHTGLQQHEGKLKTEFSFLGELLF